METRTFLNMSLSAVFDANGIARVVFSNGTTATWDVKLMNTTTTSGTQTKCTVFRGDPLPANQVDFTRQGNGDTSPTSLVLRVGDRLSVQWEQGQPGAVATFRIEGDVIQVGRRAY